MLKKIGIYTGGFLLDLKAKMAHGIIKYRNDIEVVIDNKYSAKELSQILPFVNRDIPIVSTVEQAIHEFGINEIVFGISPPGGELPLEWGKTLDFCLEKNLKIVHGFHIKLQNKEKYKAYVDINQIIELRFINHSKIVAQGKSKDSNKNIILTMGTDCASGKMTTTLEMYLEIKRRGLKADIIPTGQTCMYISQKGFAVDAIRADFMSGTIEQHVLESSKKHDFIFVEGQGTLFHPAYSSSAIALLHGASPNFIVLCHDLGREKLAYFREPVVSIEKQIAVIKALAFARECQVIAISIFSSNKSINIEKEKRKLERKYKIPICNIQEEGCKNIIDIIQGKKS